MNREVLSTVTANAHVTMPYPCLELKKLDDPVTLVLSGLEQGDLPVIGSFEGRTYKVASISNSALTIHKLVRVTELVYHRNETDSTVLRSSIDILEAEIT